MKSVKNRAHKRKKSPQYSRIFSALFYWLNYIVLWTLLFAVVGYNMYLVTHQSQQDMSIKRVFTTPRSPDPHIELADYLWQNKDVSSAKRELDIALDLARQSPLNNVSVLGLTSNSLITDWENQNRDYQIQYNYWRNVINKHPDYRDAYLALAVLAQQLELFDEAKQYVEYVKQLDPNIDLFSGTDSPEDLY